MSFLLDPSQCVGKPGVISTDNTTTTPLLASVTYSGAYEFCYQYASITIIGLADVAGTLYADFSIDGITAIRTIQLSDGLDGNFGIHSLIPVASYFRVRLINGGTGQGSFSLQTIFNAFPKIAQPTSRVSQTITDYSDVLNTRSVLVAKDTLGNFVNIGSDIDGRLKIADGIYSIFGEQVVTTYIPDSQVSHLYGIPYNNQLHVTNITTGGSIVAGTEGNSVELKLDTTSNASANLRDLRVVKYRHGYAIICRIGGRFNAGVANSLQYLGLGNTTSDLYFAMQGTQFGIRRSHRGALEVRKLTISVGAGGAESLTITLNSVDFTISVTNATTPGISFTAHEIEIGGTGAVSYTGWNVEHIGNDVIFVADTPEVRSGTYSFTNNTGGGTAAASFTQVKAGASLTTTFVAQADWNGSSGLIQTLDPVSYNNLYEIQYTWFGISNLIFRVYNPSTSLFEVVHEFEFANQSTEFSLSSPNMYVQRGIESQGSTTAMTLVSSGSFGAIMGPYDIQRQPKASVSNIKSIVADTDTVLLVLGNRLQLNGYPNQSEIILQNIFIATDGNKSVIIKIIKNPDILSADSTTDYTNFSYFDEGNSLLIYDTTADTYSGGRVVQEIIAPKSGGTTLDFIDKDIFLSKEDVIIITALSAQVNEVSISCAMISDI